MENITLDNFDTYTKSFIESYLKQRIYEAKRYAQDLSIIVFEVFESESSTKQSQEYLMNRITFLVTSLIRKSDVMARYSEYEYAIVLPNTELKGAITVAEKIKKCIDSAEIEYNNLAMNTKISIGVTDLKLSDDFESLMSRAFKLVYNAKRQIESMIMY